MENYKQSPVAQSLQTEHKGTRFINAAQQRKVYKHYRGFKSSGKWPCVCRSLFPKFRIKFVPSPSRVSSPQETANTGYMRQYIGIVVMVSAHSDVYGQC